MIRSLRSLLIRSFLVTGVLALPIALVGCESKDAPMPTAEVTSPSPHLLKADLADAVPVNEAIVKDPGADVTVVGRVRYLAKGTFTLVDNSLDYCGHGADGMDDCATPWDYCCIDQEKVAASSILVKAQTADGKPIAKADLGLRPLDLVALRGKLEKNEKGEATLVATTGWFRRERPTVGPKVKFE